MRNLERDLETKLIYHTLGSELLEESIRVTGGHVGHWHRQKSHTEGVHVFANDGAPVTFEITEHKGGRLELTRERATFFWEYAFKKFDGRSNNWMGWLDVCMWKTVIPQDIRFGVYFGLVVDEYGNHQPRGFARFEPVGGSYLPAHQGHIEIEEIFHNVGVTYDTTTVGQNAYRFDEPRYAGFTRLRQEMIDLGFVWDPKIETEARASGGL